MQRPINLTSFLTAPSFSFRCHIIKRYCFTQQCEVVNKSLPFTATIKRKLNWLEWPCDAGERIFPISIDIPSPFSLALFFRSVDSHPKIQIQLIFAKIDNDTEWNGQHAEKHHIVADKMEERKKPRWCWKNNHCLRHLVEENVLIRWNHRTQWQIKVPTEA